MDEHEQFVLLARQHGGPRNKPKTSWNVLYAFRIEVKLTADCPQVSENSGDFFGGRRRP
jgi:hypothetical protein